MVIIRLARHGSKHRPFYKVVAIDSRRARNGLPLEYLGFFNPLAKTAAEELRLDLVGIQKRIDTGAQMSDRVCFLYKKILKRNELANS